MRLTNLLSNKERKVITIILVLGILYALIVRYTHFCIPCFFHTITGLKCPGCGITHLFMCLMEFDFLGALKANAFLFITAPILFVLLLSSKLCSSKSFVKWLSIIYLILLVVWGVVRNIIHI